MNINSMSSSFNNAQAQFISGSSPFLRAAETRVNNERLSETAQRSGRTGAVDWRSLFSYTERTMSDEEMEDKVRQQARIDFARGIFQGEGFAELRNQFVSVVSPDRVGYMNNPMRGFNGGSNQVRAFNFWGSFLNSPGGGNVPPEVSALSRALSGEALSLTIDDLSGNPIIGFDRERGGWTEIFTPAERARSNAITQVYQETWNELHRQAQRENSRYEMIPSDLGVGTIDFRG